MALVAATASVSPLVVGTTVVLRVALLPSALRLKTATRLRARPLTWVKVPTTISLVWSGVTVTSLTLPLKTGANELIRAPVLRL